jgi:hypothetical protein
VGSVIRLYAHALKPLVLLLNTQWKTGELGRQVAAILAATKVVPSPFVPRVAQDLFARLAAGESFRYDVWYSDPPPRPGEVLDVSHLRTPAQRALARHLRKHDAMIVDVKASSERGMAASVVYDFFYNPARDRVRRCQQCQTWFLDLSRNKSAQRCSKACTIAWSSAHRKKGTPP